MEMTEVVKPYEPGTVAKEWLELLDKPNSALHIRLLNFPEEELRGLGPGVLDKVILEQIQRKRLQRRVSALACIESCRFYAGIDLGIESCAGLSSEGEAIIRNDSTNKIRDWKDVVKDLPCQPTLARG